MPGSTEVLFARKPAPFLAPVPVRFAGHLTFNPGRPANAQYRLPGARPVGRNSDVVHVRQSTGVTHVLDASALHRGDHGHEVRQLD